MKIQKKDEVVNKIIEVLRMKLSNGFKQHCKNILASMKIMFMKKQENSGVQKINLGRFFLLSNRYKTKKMKAM